LREIPVQSSVVLHSRQEATAFGRGELELVHCSACGFIANRLFDPDLVDPELEYEDSQSFSMTFGVFAESLARGLIQRYGLSGKRVLEIGCGKGDFLALLCARGIHEGVGVDPAADPGRLPAELAGRVRLVRDSFGLQYANLVGDLICCRHTLEHIPDVGGFLAVLREAIGDRLDTVVLFEVPDTMRILKEGAFWDVYYEHCSYFTPGSLARLFERSGFEILDLRLAYADQYVLIEARPTDSSAANRQHDRSMRIDLADDLEEIAAAIRAFPGAAERQIEHWGDRIRGAANAGQRTVIWGGGSKAVGFLTTAGLGDEVSSIVDINPHKQGRYSPGTGHLIVGPEALGEISPDLVVVMNPIYRDEIRAKLAEIGLHPEVLAIGNAC
jgi:SAM-dependent methyltransferase